MAAIEGILNRVNVFPSVKSLNDNADKIVTSDLNLVKGGAMIVESWVSSDKLSWYRKYSDGFIMQGGRCTFTHNKTTEVALHTEFATKNYYADGIVDKTTATSTDDMVVSTNGKEVDSVFFFFYDAGGNSYSGSANWVAMGY